MDKTTEIKAAVFDQLVSHLQAHPEIQNIDLMIHGQFCRNCLYKWYHAVAEAQGESLSLEEAQEAIYGMPYADYKAVHQTPASPEKLAALEKIHQTKK
ncbi:DUF1244 domain-containing protein [Ostreibacterium oceani]|uniref:DUF1244 domain-containing protein n=1 Tax=Ostreibacterium oceani TaxID=2654998 RepID=A0A6N7F1P8_9GAMM|nr:DUF1244 domain-containing protein [Ostreibacterium oceani]MPV86718.1 DUF1244 domain-containing protein [Ostreibacterium oceani]